MFPPRHSILRLFACTYLFLTVNAFSFWFTSNPTQCGQLTAQWDGGQPPFTLLLVPTGHLNPETRTIIQQNIPSGNSVTFTLNFPAQSQFVAVLNDATGIGSGGTSVVTTVGSSSSSSCLNTQPTSPKFFLFQSPTSVGQCSNIGLSWSSSAVDPVDILGLIPGGQSFEIANVTNGASSVNWQADVRSGTSIMFVAGDKDGLGSGGSTDVMSVGNGDSGCINNQSPSSTSGPAAGGVSTAAQGGQTGGGGGGGGGSGGSTAGGGSTGTNGGNPTGTNAPGATNPSDTNGSNPSGSNGNPTGTDSNGNPIGTGTNAGGGTGTGGSNPGQTGKPGGNDPGSSNVPGSGGGTVTGAPGSSDGKHSNLGLIIGIVVAAVALLGVIIGGVIVYRRRARHANAYNNLENNGTRNARRPWTSAFSAAHLRGGAASSVGSFQTMYQTDPFIIPAEYNDNHQTEYDPYAEAVEGVSESQHGHSSTGHQSLNRNASLSRPAMVGRASSNRVTSYFGDMSYVREALGGGLLGVHGAPSEEGRPQAAVVERKESIGPHGRPPSRTASGRTIPLGQRTGNRGMPPPITTEPATRLARDSEDFSPVPLDGADDPRDPFSDRDVVDIPPTYHSVQAAVASRQSSIDHGNYSRSESGHGHEDPLLLTRSLSRTNAVAQSRRSRRSTRQGGFGSDDVHVAP